MDVPISDAASSADEDDDDTCPSHTNYEVFMSFRGEDTRDGFTSHLYDALCKKKIKTFIDSRLNRGEEISSTLMKTIKESEIFVIIFSKDYASSPWCLDELVKILECKERYGRLVLPIFYNLDPSNVRKQGGSYANSFAKHSKRFKNNMDKVHKWKAALTQASNLSGLDSTKIRPEPKLIGKIVKNIFRKLKHSSSYDLEGLIGIHDHILVVESFLNLGSQDVRVVGIWGMGGTGKTSIAKATFYKLQHQFESCSFVRNVEQQLRTFGLDHIQDKYIQELIEEDIGIQSFRSLFVKKLLQRKRILLVFDDVNKLRQIEDLIKLDWFGPGSRIIITTRDMQVLKTANANEFYHVQRMSFNNALQLFSLNAFKQYVPIKDYMELSNEAVNYCEGNPLALKVLGSFLYGRTNLEWESALRKLQIAPHKEIFDVLKLSFDGLDDDQKEIFLDIAIFYEGKSTCCVKELLLSCGFFADIGIRVLIERSLVSIQNDKFVMHGLIKAMGREIVCQPNVYKSRIGRRLWKHEDIYHVLKKNKKIEEIYGLSLDVSKIKEIYLKPDAFKKMVNLQIIKFYNPYQFVINSNLHIPDGLESIPEELRTFQWDGYPHTSVPLNSCASNIVELIMPDSHVKQLWDVNQRLPNLKTINLEGSKNLVEIPDMSVAPNIRLLKVSWCTSLSHVYSSDFLPNLQGMNLNNCNALKSVNVASNKVEQRSWRLLTNNEFFILNCVECRKVSMGILKSDNSNTYCFRFNFLSVALTGISESKSMYTGSDSESDSAMLKLVHGISKSVLPNLELLRLLDKPSSLGTLSERLPLKLDYQDVKCNDAVYSKYYVMLSTYPELVGATESSCSPCMKRTGVQSAVSSWDWEENLIGTNDNLSEHDIYICIYRLSRILSSNLRWECLTQVSLHRSPSVLNSFFLYDYTRSQVAVELTFSLDNLSEISLNFAKQEKLDSLCLILDHGNKYWSFCCDNNSFENSSIVYPRILLKVQ